MEKDNNNRKSESEILDEIARLAGIPMTQLIYFCRRRVNCEVRRNQSTQ